MNDNRLFCPFCGEPNSIGTPVCRVCGRTIRTAAAGPKTPVSPLPSGGELSGENAAGPQLIEDTAPKDLLLYAGGKGPYYVKKWRSMERRKSRVSFNWAAFLLGPFWLAGRRMPKQAAVLLAVNILVIVLAALCMLPANRELSGRAERLRQPWEQMIQVKKEEVMARQEPQNYSAQQDLEKLRNELNRVTGEETGAEFLDRALKQVSDNPGGMFLPLVRDTPEYEELMSIAAGVILNNFTEYAIWLGGIVLTLVFTGLFGNRLYLTSAKKKIASLRQKYPTGADRVIAQEGGCRASYVLWSVVGFLIMDAAVALLLNQLMEKVLN